MARKAIHVDEDLLKALKFQVFRLHGETYGLMAQTYDDAISILTEKLRHTGTEDGEYVPRMKGHDPATKAANELNEWKNLPKDMASEVADVPF